jgi:tetratricopeptide (TPR) repeat protein
MTHIFDGLYGYEEVLLVLGIVLFAVLVLGLIMAFIKDKSYGGLLMFFALPIAMIAWPGIQEIKIGQNQVEIDKYSAQLQKDPTDQAARTGLTVAVSGIASRPWSDPVVLTKLATAQLMLDDTQSAKANLSKALQSKAAPVEAAALQKRIQVEELLPALTQQVQQNPADTAAKTQLQQSVTDITKTGVANPATLANVASAQAALGDNEKALSNANRALTINPRLTEAANLRNRLQVVVH